MFCKPRAGAGPMRAMWSHPLLPCTSPRVLKGRRIYGPSLLPLVLSNQGGGTGGYLREHSDTHSPVPPAEVASADE